MFFNTKKRFRDVLRLYVYRKQLFKIIRCFTKIYVYYLMTFFFSALYDMTIFLCKANTTYKWALSLILIISGDRDKSSRCVWREIYVLQARGYLRYLVYCTYIIRERRYNHEIVNIRGNVSSHVESLNISLTQFTIMYVVRLSSFNSYRFLLV